MNQLFQHIALINQQAAPPVAWLPTDLEWSLIMDMDPSETSLITHTSNEVDTLTCKGPHKLQFVQSDSPNGLRTGIDTLNSLNALSGNGTSEHLWVNGGLHLPSNGNFILCFTGDFTGGIDDSLDGYAGMSIGMASPRFYIRTGHPSQMRASVSQTGMGIGTLELNTNEINGVYTLVLDKTGVRGTANSMYLYHDGTLRDTESGTYTGIPTWLSVVWYLGCDQQRLRFLGGKYGEKIIETDVTLATQQKIEGYLAHKWGFVSGLDAGHPYKSAAPTIAANWVAPQVQFDTTITSLSFKLKYSTTAVDIDIDYGDGATDSTTSTAADQTFSHTYSGGGPWTVKIWSGDDSKLLKFELISKQADGTVYLRDFNPQTLDMYNNTANAYDIKFMAGDRTRRTVSRIYIYGAGLGGEVIVPNQDFGTTGGFRADGATGGINDVTYLAFPNCIGKFLDIYAFNQNIQNEVDLTLLDFAASNGNLRFYGNPNLPNINMTGCIGQFITFNINGCTSLSGTPKLGSTTFSPGATINVSNCGLSETEVTAWGEAIRDRAAGAGATGTVDLRTNAVPSSLTWKTDLESYGYTVLVDV